MIYLKILVTSFFAIVVGGLMGEFGEESDQDGIAMIGIGLVILGAMVFFGTALVWLWSR